MPNQRAGGAAFYEELAKKMNVFGAELKKAGLVLCYHNHGFEFEPVADGRRALDVLMSASDPDLVKLELDVFWISVAGNDPVALIKQYANRLPLLHLKDKAKGFPTQTQEMKVPPTTFTPLGQGAVDFPAVLAAGKAAGVAHYFVEQDHAQGSPLDALKASYGYLRSI
jgi:sugar phosphate isomerase/epimerase